MKRTVLSPKWLTKTKMREWLIAHGPAKQVKSGFEKAQIAERDGKLGEAFTRYAEIAEILPDTELSRTAKEISDASYCESRNRA